MVKTLLVLAAASHQEIALSETAQPIFFDRLWLV